MRNIYLIPKPVLSHAGAALAVVKETFAGLQNHKKWYMM